MSGGTHLGALSPLNPPACCVGTLETLNVVSSSGEGNVTMKPEDVPCGGCCYTCCSKGSAGFQIEVNGQNVGKMEDDGRGYGPLVTFPVTLDPRVKGIIVSLSFILVSEDILCHGPTETEQKNTLLRYE